jgi:MATE family multidrug resistance protein
MWRLVRLGTPAALQTTLEVGVFAAVAALAGRISATALAANQVTLNVAGFFFMIPFGLSSAAAVAVGHAVGRGDLRAARRAGWLALGISAALAAVVAALFATMPALFILPFSSDAAVLAVGTTILLVCAVFQPFDACQVVATGALRGLGDTRTPMLLNLAGHWIVGLPAGYALCFWFEWGVIGLWVGLSAGLILIGATTVGVWHRRSVGLLRASP